MESETWLRLSSIRRNNSVLLSGASDKFVMFRCPEPWRLPATTPESIRKHKCMPDLPDVPLRAAYQVILAGSASITKWPAYEPLRT